MRPSLLRDRRGGVAVMAAVSGMLLCAVAALVVDVGSVALTARQAQGAADLAALAALMDEAKSEAAARATVHENLGAAAGATVNMGVWTADPNLAPDARFRAGAGPANAARVSVSTEAPLYFGRLFLGRDTAPVVRKATAARAAAAPMAAFTIGSRLAGLDGGMANQLLSGLTGTNVSLSVMDYRQLADVQVDLPDLLDSLATRAGVTAGDYEALADARIGAGDLLRVLVPADDPAAPVLERLAQASGSLTLRVGDLIGVEAEAPDGAAGGLEAAVSALDMAMTALEIASGRRQLTLTQTAGVGLASLEVRLAIGERPNHSPWLALTGDDSVVIRTAQTRLYLRARTSQSLASLGRVDLPLLIELAASEARLDAVECDPEAVTLGVKPGLARARIAAIDTGALDDFTRDPATGPAVLASVAGIASVTGAAAIEAAGPGYGSVRFSQSDIENEVTRSRGTRLSNIVTGLISSLDIQVKIPGLGIGLGGLAQTAATLLAPLGPVLDTTVDPLLEALGLKFGVADVTVVGVQCPTDTLPQLVG